MRMRWTDMVVTIIGMLLAVICLFGFGYCVHKSNMLTFECMVKTGKAKSECRFQ